MTHGIGDQRRFGQRPDLTAAAVASLAAAGVALAIQLSEPFAHGAWLVAYLALVGFTAQFLLGRGQAALVAAGGLGAPSDRAQLAQLVLWNLGVVAVPAGVLADTRMAVVAGSVCLIAALVSFYRTARPGLASPAGIDPVLRWGYRALLALMATSTLIGTALAWDIPWT